ncbi:MAG TPA: PfkB family carbohydrate kinase [bacterium]|nr:PfkB family carbohydrate kinase [bacterium]HOL46740.1 PfkB family carbohydrate kinase [bacterium]HPQ18176.1 PfkB family carbohydrate kinase [bacterium]
MSGGVLVVGSVALDSVRTPLGEVENAFGGAAVYFSFAASFFTKPYIIGVIGEDMPQENINLLTSRNIDIKGLQKIKGGQTFKWKGYYSFDMNEANTLDTQLNVFEKFSPELPEEYKKIEYVFLANIDPELQMKVIEQVKKPKLIGLDTMNYWLNSKRDELLEVIKKIDLIIINDAEARDLAGEKYLLTAAKKIFMLGPKYVVIKKGEHGVLFYSEDGIIVLPAYPTELVKDPTGAGDTFAGAFMGYIASKNQLNLSTIKNGLIYGTLMASFTIEDFSINRLKNLKNEELENRYKKYKEMLTI